MRCGKKDIAKDIIFLHSVYMQRRPLDPIPFTEDDVITPFDRLKNYFFRHSNENSNILCATPLIYSKDYVDLFNLIGFRKIPVHINGPREQLYPKNAPKGNHPTGFLQFGAAIRSKRHVVFEIGDYASLVRFDFKESYPEGHGEPIYQLDELQIWDGESDYSLDCEDEEYKKYIDSVISVISNTILAMSEGDYNRAKQKFGELNPVLQRLHDWSDQLDAEYNAEIMALEMRRRSQESPNTP